MQPGLIIGIAGGTASGKSWLAQYLQRELGERAAVVSQDWYHKDHAGMDVTGEMALNFDHPDAFDTALLAADLDSLRHGEPVEAPRYDYHTHARLPGRRLEPAPVIVLEGILVLHHERIRQWMDHAIFVDTPADLRLIRRLRRDSQEHALPVEESLRLYETFVRPMHERYVQPTARRADHVWHTQREPSYPEELAAAARKML